MADYGFSLANGIGVARDEAAALAWERKAAAAGHPIGMFYLGSMLEEGKEGQGGRDAAIGWYRKAAALGLEEARAALVRLQTP